MNTSFSRRTVHNIQNAISNTIDTAEQEAQYDACVKKLLSEKIILAWILKECVAEFKPYSIEKIMKDCIEGESIISTIAVNPDELDYSEDLSDTQIEGLNSEDSSIKEGKIYYDIRFSAIVPNTKEPVHLIINIEAQKNDNTPYSLIKRAIYYVSRMISSQKNTVFTKSHYERIRKVYSIWIQMNVSPDKANTITRYRLSEENVVGSVKEKESNYDLLSIIMLGLGNANEAKDNPILRLLDILLAAETKPCEKKELLEKDFDIPMSSEMDEEENIMCNLGAGIREQATIETHLNDIINLMTSLNLSADKAADALKIPNEEKRALLAMIDSQLITK